MKKVLLILCTLISIPMIGEMRYDSVSKYLYSYPESPEIDQKLYSLLLNKCLMMKKLMDLCLSVCASKGQHVEKPSIEEILEECSEILQDRDNPTVLRLIEDLKKNAIYNRNGTFIKAIFE